MCIRDSTNTLGRIGIFDAGATDSFSGDFVVELNPGTNGDSTQEKFRVTSDGDVNATSGHLQAQDLKLGLAADRYPIIQRAVQSSGSQNLSITAGSGYSEHTGSAHSLVDAREGAMIQLGSGDPTSDTYGGYIKYYAHGHTSPNNPGNGNSHTFYTRSAANTNTERFRITSDGKFGLGTNNPQAFIEAKSIDGSDAFDALRLINTHADSSYANSTRLKLGITNAGGEKTTSIRAIQEGAAANAVSLAFYTNSSGSNNGDTVKLTLTGDSGAKFENYPSGNIIKYGPGSANQTNAAINMYRGGNQYCNISIGSNYGCGLYISGANSTQTDMLVLQQDNSKNACLLYTSDAADE